MEKLKLPGLERERKRQKLSSSDSKSSSASGSRSSSSSSGSTSRSSSASSSSRSASSSGSLVSSQASKSKSRSRPKVVPPVKKARAASKSPTASKSRSPKKASSHRKSRSLRRSSKRVRCPPRKSCSPKRSRSPRRRKARSPTLRPTKFHVGRPTRNVDKEHIVEMNPSYGTLKNVEMLPDRFHPEFSKGHAYVEYEQPDDAGKAVLHMDGGRIDGQEVTAAAAAASLPPNPPLLPRHPSPVRSGPPPSIHEIDGQEVTAAASLPPNPPLLPRHPSPVRSGPPPSIHEIDGQEVTAAASLPPNPPLLPRHPSPVHSGPPPSIHEIDGQEATAAAASLPPNPPLLPRHPSPVHSGPPPSIHEIDGQEVTAAAAAASLPPNPPLLPRRPSPVRSGPPPSIHEIDGQEVTAAAAASLPPNPPLLPRRPSPVHSGPPPRWRPSPSMLRRRFVDEEVDGETGAPDENQPQQQQQQQKERPDSKQQHQEADQQQDIHGGDEAQGGGEDGDEGDYGDGDQWEDENEDDEEDDDDEAEGEDEENDDDSEQERRKEEERKALEAQEKERKKKENHIESNRKIMELGQKAFEILLDKFLPMTEHLRSHVTALDTSIAAYKCTIEPTCDLILPTNSSAQVESSLSIDIEGLTRHALTVVTSLNNLKRTDRTFYESQMSFNFLRVQPLFDDVMNLRMKHKEEHRMEGLQKLAKQRKELDKLHLTLLHPFYLEVRRDMVAAGDVMNIIKPWPVTALIISSIMDEIRCFHNYCTILKDYFGLPELQRGLPDNSDEIWWQRDLMWILDRNIAACTNNISSFAQELISRQGLDQQGNIIPVNYIALQAIKDSDNKRGLSWRGEAILICKWCEEILCFLIDHLASLQPHRKIEAKQIVIALDPILSELKKKNTVPSK